MRSTIVESDEETFDYDNPLFERINSVPRYEIALHVTHTKNRSNKRDDTSTQHLLQGKCKVFQKNTAHVCLGCADTDAVKN